MKMEKIPFSILSEGEQQAITIKGLTELLGGENALFLFDEPDTFLHPQWQRNFISEIEQNVELNHHNELCYLIATHSPQILSNAHPDKTSVRIIEDGQLVQQTPKHYGREISSILYNLMGVEERNEVIKKRLSELFMLIEDEEIEEAESLLTELTELLGDTDADIQNATLQLNYLKNETD
jgi:predicted ATP-binding protein involved in virulence